MRTRGAQKARGKGPPRSGDATGRIRGPHEACFVGWIGARGPVGLFGRTSRTRPGPLDRSEPAAGGRSRPTPSSDPARSPSRLATLSYGVASSDSFQRSSASDMHTLGTLAAVEVPAVHPGCHSDGRARAGLAGLSTGWLAPCPGQVAHKRPNAERLGSVGGCRKPPPVSRVAADSAWSTGPDGPAYVPGRPYMCLPGRWAARP